MLVDSVGYAMLKELPVPCGVTEVTLPPVADVVLIVPARGQQHRFEVPWLRPIEIRRSE